jgi:hypothetical protein
MGLMEKIQRVIPSITAWAQGTTPYPTAQVRPGMSSLGSQAPNKNGLVLKHDYCGWVPHDIGIPAPAHADEEAMGASFPPPDIDEAAGFIGRIRMLGPIVGRALMLFGGLWAMWATVQAAFGLQEDSAQRQTLKTAATRHLNMPNEGNAHNLGRTLARAATESAVSWAANLVLLPGSLGMGINLLGSAELAGHFLPALVPFADAAMIPAVSCMAVYGGIVAVKAIYDFMVSRQRSERLALYGGPMAGVSAQESQAITKLLLDKERSRRRWDAGLAAAGLAQAVGAVLQYTIGPVFLAVLLPGTFALGFGKLGKAKSLGHSIYLPMPDLAPLRANSAVLGRALLASQSKREALTTLKANQNHTSAAVQEALGSMMGRVPEASGGVVEDVQTLVAGMDHLQLFAPFALLVAQDTSLPRTSGFVNDGTEYTITPDDVIALVAAPQGDAAHLSHTLHRHARNVLTGAGLFAELRREAALADVLMQALC